MRDGFTIRPLRCGHCGNELPVMGEYVTFLCETCCRYWILNDRGFEPLTVYRAAAGGGGEAEPIHLPFWVIRVDEAGLRRRVDELLDGIKCSAQVVLSAKIEADQPDEAIMEFTAVHEEMNRKNFIREASTVVKIPTRAEIIKLLSLASGDGGFNVYVPAFNSRNTYAYLKVGRLLTRKQPPLRLDKSEGHGRPVLCSLRADQAVELMDFIFIATLPEAVSSNGRLIEGLRLEPAASPILVEFPFEPRSHSLISLIGGFSISRRLVEVHGRRRDAL